MNQYLGQSCSSVGNSWGPSVIWDQVGAEQPVEALVKGKNAPVIHAGCCSLSI